MTSYSVYKLTNNNFDNYENKNLFDTEFYLNRKSNYTGLDININSQFLVPWEFIEKNSYQLKKEMVYKWKTTQ
jgi:hypothetical protein